MPTIIIPAKMSGTGTIHDLESDLQDRKIKIPTGGYAVVLAAYYGGGTTTHRTWDATLYKDHLLPLEWQILAESQPEPEYIDIEQEW